MNSDCQNYIEPDISQTPGESIIYTVDWPSRGLPDGVTIISQSYAPSGTTDYNVSNAAIVSPADVMTSFQLTGGVPGNRYTITNNIALSDGEHMSAALVFECVLQNYRRRSTCL